MKIIVAALAALAVAVSAPGKSATDRQVTVYLHNGNFVPFVVRANAETLASEMFARIGVTLNLREARPPASETAAIIIEFADRTPAGFQPGAWAYALPFEGLHIRIFWDRMQLEPHRQELLAHVMAHEITHILQGVDRHAARGIMNARWTDKERFAMERSPLGFTQADVELIYLGMDARGAHRPGQGLAAMPLKAGSISAAQ
jgi:hypothetical protein